MPRTAPQFLLLDENEPLCPPAPAPPPPPGDDASSMACARVVTPRLRRKVSNIEKLMKLPASRAAEEASRGDDGDLDGVLLALEALLWLWL
jgi:hypothetical protein